MWRLGSQCERHGKWPTDNTVRVCLECGKAVCKKCLKKKLCVDCSLMKESIKRLKAAIKAAALKPGLYGL